MSAVADIESPEVPTFRANDSRESKNGRSTLQRLIECTMMHKAGASALCLRFAASICSRSSVNPDPTRAGQCDNERSGWRITARLLEDIRASAAWRPVLCCNTPYSNRGSILRGKSSVLRLSTDILKQRQSSPYENRIQTVARIGDDTQYCSHAHPYSPSISRR